MQVGGIRSTEDQTAQRMSSCTASCIRSVLFFELSVVR